MTDKQPEALVQMLQPGGIVPIDIETTAALVAEITRQHEAIERKDALLRRLISALDSDRHDVDDWPPESCEVVYAIKQELSQ